MKASEFKKHKTTTIRINDELYNMFKEVGITPQNMIDSFIDKNVLIALTKTIEGEEPMQLDFKVVGSSQDVLPVVMLKKGAAPLLSELESDGLIEILDEEEEEEQTEIEDDREF